MRATTRHAACARPIHWMRAACCAGALAAFAVAPVGAQRRSASVRVNVTVLDFAASDVIGAHGVQPTGASPALGASAGVRQDGETWRITSGSSSAVGVRLEALGASAESAFAPSVALCQVVARMPADCRQQEIPAARISAGDTHPDLLLRFRPGAVPVPDGSGASPLRLTIAYIGS